MANPLLAPVIAWLGRLKHPQLFVISAILLGINLIVPDMVPFVDELLLAVMTLWLGNRRRNKKAKAPIEPAA